MWIIAAGLAAVSACAVDTRDVELSYRLTQDWCEGCYGFELTLRNRGRLAILLAALVAILPVPLSAAERPPAVEVPNERVHTAGVNIQAYRCFTTGIEW